MKTALASILAIASAVALSACGPPAVATKQPQVKLKPPLQLRWASSTGTHASLAVDEKTTLSQLLPLPPEAQFVHPGVLPSQASESLGVVADTTEITGGIRYTLTHGGRSIWMEELAVPEPGAAGKKWFRTGMDLTGEASRLVGEVIRPLTIEMPELREVTFVSSDAKQPVVRVELHNGEPSALTWRFPTR